MKLPNRAKDITDMTFGSLTALAPTKVVNRMVYWNFECKCGNTHEARANTITYEAKKGIKNIPSCGCAELANKTKHGFRKANKTHPAYRIYRRIMDSCYDPNHAQYRFYGAKGTHICEEWKGNPEIFVKWCISNGWKSGLHLDKDIKCKELNIYPRIYSPKTCQFVSCKVNVSTSTNRTNYGSNPNVKLSSQEVREILHIYHAGYKVSGITLAEIYNVTPPTIYRLIRLDKAESYVSVNV